MLELCIIYRPGPGKAFVVLSRCFPLSVSVFLLYYEFHIPQFTFLILFILVYFLKFSISKIYKIYMVVKQFHS